MEATRPGCGPPQAAAVKVVTRPAGVKSGKHQSDPTQQETPPKAAAGKSVSMCHTFSHLMVQHAVRLLLEQLQLVLGEGGGPVAILGEGGVREGKAIRGEVEGEGPAVMWLRGGEVEGRTREGKEGGESSSITAPAYMFHPGGGHMKYWRVHLPPSPHAACPPDKPAEQADDLPHILARTGEVRGHCGVAGRHLDVCTHQ